MLSSNCYVLHFVVTLALVLRYISLFCIIFEQFECTQHIFNKVVTKKQICV